MKPWLNIIVLITLAGGLRADETFDRTIKPFLNTYCVSCHGPDKQKAKLAEARALGMPSPVRAAGPSALSPLALLRLRPRLASDRQAPK